MATNSNQTRGAEQHRSSGYASGNGQHRSGAHPGGHSTSAQAAKAARQRAAKKKRKIIIFAVEIVLLLAMVGVLWVVWGKSEEGPTIVEMPSEPEEIGIAAPVQENPVMKGYWNIALFGVDANNSSELMKGGRSDSIMIASINMDTGDIKLVSVYRDTFLNVGKYNNEDNYYIKCNHAYSYGGGEQAVSMLNSNLDMDINDFVAIGYEGLKGVIDGLGGVYLDVDDEELKHINNYQISIAQVLKCDYTPVEKTGYQLLDGMQAAAYCRIRYRKGDDFARAAAQREVIMAIEEQAKKADLATLTNVLEEAMKHVVTTLTTADILPYLSKIGDYQIVAEGGFPEESMRTTANVGSKGSSVIPLSLESNVLWLHQFLFEDDQDYELSDKVKEYSAKIEAQTSQYLNK